MSVENKIKRKLKILNTFSKLDSTSPKKNFKIHIRDRNKFVYDQVDLYNKKDLKKREEDLRKKQGIKSQSEDKTIENKDIEEFNKEIKEKFKDKNFSFRTATNGMILDLMMHNKFLRNYFQNSSIETILSTENSESYYYNNTIDSGKKSIHIPIRSRQDNNYATSTFLTSVTSNKYDRQKIRAHNIYEEQMKKRKLTIRKKKIALKKLEGEYKRLMPKIEKAHKRNRISFEQDTEKFKRKPKDYNYLVRPFSYNPKQRILSNEFGLINKIERPALMTSIIVNEGIKDENEFSEKRKMIQLKQGMANMNEIEDLLDYKKPIHGYQDGSLNKEYFHRRNEILSKLNEKTVRDNFKYFKKKFNIN